MQNWQPDKTPSLLICGSAPCLHEDLAKALDMRDDKYCAVMAINDAARWIKAELIFSLHPEKMCYWADAQKRYSKAFTTHSTADSDRHKLNYPAVNYWWDGVISSGTSAWSGCLVGLKMGFQEIILCGCPMNGGDGYAGATEGGSPSNPRFGFKSPDSGLVMNYKDCIASVSHKPEGLRVFSMSGYTAEKFGYPPQEPLWRQTSTSATEHLAG